MSPCCGRVLPQALDKLKLNSVNQLTYLSRDPASEVLPPQSHT